MRAAVVSLALLVAGCVQSGPQRTMLDDAVETCALAGRPPGHPQFQRCLELYPVAVAMTPPTQAPSPAPTVNVVVEQPAPDLSIPFPVTCTRAGPFVNCM